ncbi:ECF transporter S component [uncultured Oscillibacter sp.]|jgi:predicted membrane protein|uniref:ECF transporter S component n=1 Tax=uncultured Oscillibacter sp. TaxID=876091 RepID=UPI0025F0246F|nr:ECF transporter S component [uncultured Oscillibacter sp.]
MNKSKTQSPLRTLVTAAMLLALGLVLPFLTGQIPQIGKMLCPMHLPVLLCGLLCGWKYGLAVGLILPPLRYVLFFAPPLFPTGTAMAFELAAYGFLAGFLYARSRWQCVVALYRCLIAAMLGGRVVWAVVQVILSGVSGQAFTWQMFLSGAFLTAIPGIILQLVFIPAVMVALDRTGLVRFRRSGETAPAV